MIKRIGTKLYYCNRSGNVLVLQGDMQGYIKETTFDEDIEIYTELKERDRDSIGVLVFKYGEYPKLSQGSTGVMVDLETKELVFSYEELPELPQEPGEIEKLKAEQCQQNEEILVNMLANTEMFEMILGMMPTEINLNSKNNGVSMGICDIYVSLIEKGIKTINDVPVQILEQVKNKLKL